MALSSVVRVNGPFRRSRFARRSVKRGLPIRTTARRAASRATAFPVVTLDGDAVPRAASRLRRQPRGCARHSRDQARDQGAARADSGRARRLFRLAEETAALEAAIAHGVTGNRRAERRASQAGKGDRRLRRAAAARDRRDGAARAEGRAARARAPPGRRGARRARSPAGRGARLDRAARRRSSRSPTSG